MCVSCQLPSRDRRESFKFVLGKNSASAWHGVRHKTRNDLKNAKIVPARGGKVGR